VSPFDGDTQRKGTVPTVSKLTIILIDNDGKGRTSGYIVGDDGTVDEQSIATQIEEGELDEAFGDAEECPRCEEPLDSDDCENCGMTAEEIHEENRPRCTNFDECGHRIFMGDWDTYEEYYCSDCVTVLDEVPDYVPARMFP